MKVLIVLAVALLGVQADWGADSDQCVADLKLNKETILGLNMDIVPEDNADLNKYLECFWKKLRTLKANGDIDWEKLEDVNIKILNKQFSQYAATLVPLMGPAIEFCKLEKIQGASYGQKVAKVQNCITIRTTIADQLKFTILITTQPKN